jgi:hypothetical protein
MPYHFHSIISNHQFLMIIVNFVLLSQPSLFQFTLISPSKMSFVIKLSFSHSKAIGTKNLFISFSLLTPIFLIHYCIPIKFIKSQFHLISILVTLFTTPITTFHLIILYCYCWDLFYMNQFHFNSQQTLNLLPSLNFPTSWVDFLSPLIFRTTLISVNGFIHLNFLLLILTFKSDSLNQLTHPDNF